MIEVYRTSNCGDCIRTVAFLKEKKVELKEIFVSGNEEAIKKVKEINGGFASVPTLIFDDGSTMTEPSNEELIEKLGL